MAAEMKVTALFLVLLAGCTNTTDPILTEDRCVERQSYTAVMMVPNGNGGMRAQPIVQTRCVRSVTIAYPNPDYKESSK